MQSSAKGGYPAVGVERDNGVREVLQRLYVVGAPSRIIPPDTAVVP